MENVILKSENFGQRILVGRWYLPKDKCTKEQVSILAELLNLSFLSQKKCYSSLAGGTLSYSVYHFRNGYMLEGILSQSHVKGLSYVLKNPYQAGTELLLSSKKDVLLSDEKSFAVAKERLLGKKATVYSGFSYLLSSLEADYSTPLFEDRIVRDVKIDEVLSLYEAFLSSPVGDRMLLGDPLKKDPLFKVSGKEKDPSLLEERRYIDGCLDVMSAFDSEEGKVFLLSLGRKISTIEDYEALSEALVLLSLQWKEKLAAVFGSEVKIQTELLNSEEVALSLFTEKGKFAILEDKLPWKDGKLLWEEKESEEARTLLNQAYLYRMIYSSSAYEEARRRKDYHVLSPETFFEKPIVEKERVFAFLQALTVTGSLSLNLKKEGQNND